ncbi:MAG: hypothetical protein NZM38_08920 [Cytophagales bacterium]|nr:hypothetical protein [Cytophagales bacterium]MDW8384881.1 hypothetical protein [Flammeovirgaceae bacterium]
MLLRGFGKELQFASIRQAKPERILFSVRKALHAKSILAEVWSGIGIATLGQRSRNEWWQNDDLAYKVRDYFLLLFNTQRQKE